MKEALKKSYEILLKNGEYAEAEKLLVPYMKENPEDYDAKLLYGTCRMMQGDSETAKLIHQQAQMYFESGKEIPEEQKSFWDKYKKLIFYGAIGAALVLAGGAYLGKQVKLVDFIGYKYAGPEYNNLQLYAGPEYYKKEQEKPENHSNKIKTDENGDESW